MTEYVSAYDEGTHDLFFRYADACRRYLFPGTVDTPTLDTDEKAELLRVVGKAALALREKIDPAKFPPPDGRGHHAGVRVGAGRAGVDTDADGERVSRELMRRHAGKPTTLAQRWRSAAVRTMTARRTSAA